MNKQEKISINGVPETMLQTMYARAKETKKENAVIHDEKAVEIVEKLDYDFTLAGYTYILWSAANWYDCVVIDWLWFCHSKRVVIPGTEGMKGYKDYLFHAKGSLKGMLLGIPAALVAGIFVFLIS